MANLRYTVGQTYIFVREDFTPKQLRMSTLYCPWEDELHATTYLTLRCIEHHRVREAYAPEDSEPKCDGFIFVDLTFGKRYANQFPTAYYGQLDDSCDRRIHLYVDASSTEEELDQSMRHFVDAKSHLETIAKGVEMMKPHLDKKDYDSFVEYYETCKRKFADLTGRTFVILPWVHLRQKSPMNPYGCPVSLFIPTVKRVVFDDDIQQPYFIRAAEAYEAVRNSNGLRGLA